MSRRSLDHLTSLSDAEKEEVFEFFSERDRLNDIARTAFEIEQAELIAEVEYQLYGAPARERYS